MRRHFLNVTFWSIHAALTPRIILSTCSDADYEFGTKWSGLPFFDVFRSECFIERKKTGQSFFKPSLLGVKTIFRLKEKLAGDWTDVDYVYYSEADQARAPRGLFLRRIAAAPRAADVAIPLMNRGGAAGCRRGYSSDESRRRRGLPTWLFL